MAFFCVLRFRGFSLMPGTTLAPLFCHVVGFPFVRVSLLSASLFGHCSLFGRQAGPACLLKLLACARVRWRLTFVLVGRVRLARAFPFSGGAPLCA